MVNPDNVVFRNLPSKNVHPTDAYFPIPPSMSYNPNIKIMSFSLHNEA